MKLRHINTEISQLATMEAVNMLSEHGKQKLEEFRYLKSLHESKVKNLGIHGVSNNEVAVCYNPDCFHQENDQCKHPCGDTCDEQQTDC